MNSTRSSLLLAVLLISAPSSIEGFSQSSTAASSKQWKGRAATAGFRSSQTKLFDTEWPMEIKDITSVLSQKEKADFEANPVFNPNVEFDLDAAELTAFTKTAAAKDALQSTTTSSSSLQSVETSSIESEFGKGRKIRAKVSETGTDSMKTYMKSMCNHDLLNKNEEIILGREIQILLKWEAEREKLEEKLLRYVASLTAD
jgi:hypothetical protein